MNRDVIQSRCKRPAQIRTFGHSLTALDAWMEQGGARRLQPVTRTLDPTAPLSLRCP
jgi:hypothetical protein